MGAGDNGEDAMTDDLVKRLRSPEVFLMTSGMISPVAYEAADRIEKLEAALRKIKDLHHGPEDDDVLWIRDDMTYKIVCDTLEGKDD